MKCFKLEAGSELIWVKKMGVFTPFKKIFYLYIKVYVLMLDRIYGYEFLADEDKTLELGTGEQLGYCVNYLFFSLFTC